MLPVQQQLLVIVQVLVLPEHRVRKALQQIAINLGDLEQDLQMKVQGKLYVLSFYYLNLFIVSYSIISAYKQYKSA